MTILHYLPNTQIQTDGYRFRSTLIGEAHLITRTKALSMNRKRKWRRYLKPSMKSQFTLHRPHSPKQKFQSGKSCNHCASGKNHFSKLTGFKLSNEKFTRNEEQGYTTNNSVNRIWQMFFQNFQNFKIFHWNSRSKHKTFQDTKAQGC